MAKLSIISTMRVISVMIVVLLGQTLAGCSSSETDSDDAAIYISAGDGLPFSESVRAGDFVILAGQMGTDPVSGNLVEGGMAAEAQQAMENIGTALAKHGLGFDDVVKCTVMLDNMADWPAFNTVYTQYFESDRLPARSAFGADGLAVGGVVEVECWAYVED